MQHLKKNQAGKICLAWFCLLLKQRILQSVVSYIVPFNHFGRLIAHKIGYLGIAKFIVGCKGDQAAARTMCRKFLAERLFYQAAKIHAV